ncbi:hypothetical protein [Paenibacillus sp. CF384]|nr:hypothetical protein [Paenibacillus sp. CF384]
MVVVVVVVVRDFHRTRPIVAQKATFQPVNGRKRLNVAEHATSQS